MFRLRVDDVDFLGRRLLVRQQVKVLNGKVYVAAPKGGKHREVPLPEAVAVAIAERLRAVPAGDDGLVFTTARGHRPLNRNDYNRGVWEPALACAGVEPTRENGMHALRHCYASVLLDAGESIRALGRSSRPRGSWVHASRVCAHDADVRGPDAASCRRHVPGACRLSADYRC